MENENIMYRRLRNSKRAKTGKTSMSYLLNKNDRKKSQKGEGKKKQYSIMTQNVSRYEHMLKHPYTKQNYINWIVKLRQPIEFKDRQQEKSQFTASVPAVYHKSTQARQNSLKARNLSECRSFNSADFFEAISRKQCLKHLQQNNLGYMTNLRAQNKTISPSKPKFCNLPSKDRKQYPSFLTKNAIKKISNITKKQKQSAFDGSQNFPAYSSKINTQKNYGILSTFTKCPNKPSLPILCWQMGLRG